MATAERAAGVWEITVTVPAAATAEERDAIFDGVALAAYEAEPRDRKWDVLVAGHLVTEAAT
jgi:hypothetical protein